MAKLFRRTLFGYKKKDVIGYIEKISNEFQAQLDESKAAIEDYEKQRAILDEKRAKLEKERETISNAIVSAHEKADKIIADAREKSEKELSAMYRKLEDENHKLVKIRREINNIRRNAIKTLSGFDAGDVEEETEE